MRLERIKTKLPTGKRTETMTRKDYILLAGTLKECVEANSFDASIQSGVINAANQIAYALSQENARFDAVHFMAVVRSEKELNSRPVRKTNKPDYRATELILNKLFKTEPDSEVR